MTSELPYYNTKNYYTYLNTEFLFNDYNLHSFNTLGALETITMEKSGGAFDAIRPNNIDGAPYYEFINSTTQETNIMQEGLNMLIELGVDRYKQGAANWKITENDINAIFTHLGGGSMYTMPDGRTVLEWWKDGSSTGLKSDRSFGDRLSAFNDRIEFLADSNDDYEAWINKFYPDNGPGWIDFGKVQLKSYEWMMKNLKHLHYHVHLEDVDFLRKIGSI